MGNQLLVNSHLLDTKYFVISSLDKNNNEKGDFEQTLNLKKGYFANNSSLNIYPNPFAEQFTIYTNSEFLGKLKISIYDLSGKQVFNQTLNNQSKEIKINPNNLKKGFYLGKIIAENGTSKTFKVIKE